MRVAVVPGPGRSGLLCELNEDGSKRGGFFAAEDLSLAIARYESTSGHRWVWAATASFYPRLLAAGVRVGRCHDVALADALIQARDRAAAATARAGTSEAGTGEAGTGMAGTDRAGIDRARELLRPAQLPTVADGGAAQQALFSPAEAGQAAGQEADPAAVLDALIEVHADQLAAIGRDEHPGKFGMLVAAESAGGLVAAEMTRAGLPWRADVHDGLLTELLGPRPAVGSAWSGSATPPRPARLAELATQIAAAFGTRRPVNPDSPSQVLRALAADGVRLPSTRLAVLKDADHPVIAPLIEYKELARLHSAFGWSWLDTWVAGGRFRPEYVVGGVVSGRWASRGGGALQIPRMLRRAVVADPGWVLVVADAAQLEPRVLAALAGDRAFAAAAASGDLYAELASAFGGDRAKAKVALLSAMYGGAGGEAGQLLAVLRQRFPTASGYVEAAARAGEEGRVVKSVLGRTCPPPSARWRELTEESADPEAERDPSAGSASRARGRFTRNFVVQASAADWALVMLANLRTRLVKTLPQSKPAQVLPAGEPMPTQARQSAAMLAQLVFFQHDEVIVHCPAELADDVVAAAAAAAEDAARQVFGPTSVLFPLTTAVVTCYADAK
ncbi:MAG TPA: bifunctional 3'-5' exonuclease/DNA polymerase [Streptosporangiaceae bacterium]|nr:bifunctional 3'-5' exonuclease/DNA polymerase [Streptosporangiaceae bacterium]